MIAPKTDSTTEINTIEELALFSLDRTAAGLDRMRREAARCGAALRGNDLRLAVAGMKRLTEHLHVFDRFEYDLCALFNVRRENIAGGAKDLKATAARFRCALGAMPSLIEGGDTIALAGFLTGELQGVLADFKDLMPRLRRNIADNVSNTGCGK